MGSLDFRTCTGTGARPSGALTQVADALLASASDVVDALASVEAAHKPRLPLAESAISRWYVLVDHILDQARGTETGEAFERAATQAIVAAALCFEDAAELLTASDPDKMDAYTARAVDAARRLASDLLTQAEAGRWVELAALSQLTDVPPFHPPELDVSAAMNLPKDERLVIAVLGSNSEGRTVDALGLARKAGIRLTRIYRVVDDLEAERLILSREARDDARRFYSLTDKGRDYAEGLSESGNILVPDEASVQDGAGARVRDLGMSI